MPAAIGLRHPASASCLGRHSRLAGRCPNNSSLFSPLAAVVDVYKRQEQDCADILSGLASIADDLSSGALTIDPAAEDVHTFVEQTLTARIGDAGKRLHTGRSRNDQVALDIRLTLRDYSKTLQAYIVELVRVLCKKAAENTASVMPGYTHLQRAQPITFGHALMAYASMLLRDLDRLSLIHI